MKKMIIKIFLFYLIFSAMDASKLHSDYYLGREYRNRFFIYNENIIALFFERKFEYSMNNKIIEIHLINPELKRIKKIKIKQGLLLSEGLHIEFLYLDKDNNLMVCLTNNKLKRYELWIIDKRGKAKLKSKINWKGSSYILPDHFHSSIFTSVIQQKNNGISLHQYNFPAKKPVNSIFIHYIWPKKMFLQKKFINIKKNVWLIVGLKGNYPNEKMIVYEADFNEKKINLFMDLSEIINKNFFYQVRNAEYNDEKFLQIITASSLLEKVNLIKSEDYIYFNFLVQTVGYFKTTERRRLYKAFFISGYCKKNTNQCNFLDQNQILTEGLIGMIHNYEYFLRYDQNKGLYFIHRKKINMKELFDK